MKQPPVQATSTWLSGRRPRIPETVLDLCTKSGPLQPLDVGVLLRLSQLQFYDDPYPGHGRAAALWDLPVSQIRNAIDRALAAGVLVATYRGPGTSYRYVLHDPAREAQTPDLQPAPHPAPKPQTSLPVGGRHPAPDTLESLTAALPTKGQSVQRQRQQPRRMEEVFAHQDALDRLLATAKQLRPRQIDLEADARQLASLDLSRRDIIDTQAAMLDQLHQITALGAWLYTVAENIRDTRQADADQEATGS